MTQGQQIFIATLHLVSAWANRTGLKPSESPDELLEEYKEEAALLCKQYNSL